MEAISLALGVGSFATRIPHIIRGVRDITHNRESPREIQENLRWLRRLINRLDRLIRKWTGNKQCKVPTGVTKASKRLVVYGDKLHHDAEEFYERIQESGSFRFMQKLGLIFGENKVAQYDDRLSAAGEWLKIAQLTILLYEAPVHHWREIDQLDRRNRRELQNIFGPTRSRRGLMRKSQHIRMKVDIECLLRSAIEITNNPAFYSPDPSSRSSSTVSSGSRDWNERVSCRQAKPSFQQNTVPLRRTTHRPDPNDTLREGTYPANIGVENPGDPWYPSHEADLPTFDSNPRDQDYASGQGPYYSSAGAYQQYGTGYAEHLPQRDSQSIVGDSLFVDQDADTGLDGAYREQPSRSTAYPSQHRSTSWWPMEPAIIQAGIQVQYDTPAHTASYGNRPVPHQHVSQSEAYQNEIWPDHSTQMKPKRGGHRRGAPRASRKLYQTYEHPDKPLPPPPGRAPSRAPSDGATSGWSDSSTMVDASSLCGRGRRDSDSATSSRETSRSRASRDSVRGVDLSREPPVSGSRPPNAYFTRPGIKVPWDATERKRPSSHSSDSGYASGSSASGAESVSPRRRHSRYR